MGWDEDEGPVARLGGERGEAESEAQEQLKAASPGRPCLRDD